MRTLSVATATIGLTLAFASTGASGHELVLPVILGTNLGIGFTSLLVGLPTWEARRDGVDMYRDDRAELTELHRKVLHRFDTAISVLATRDRALALQFLEEGDTLKRGVFPFRNDTTIASGGQPSGARFQYPVPGCFQHPPPDQRSVEYDWAHFCP